MDRTVEELMGFEVYVPSRVTDNVISMTISKTGCRLSKYSLGILGGPSHAVVFFDRTGRRMMVRAGKKGTANIMKLASQGNYPNTLTQENFLQEVMKLSGIEDLSGGWFVIGSQAKSSEPSLLFDLNRIQKRRKNVSA